MSHPSSASQVTGATLQRALAAAPAFDQPFRHWRPRGLLDGDTALALASLPMPPPDAFDLSRGTREANNASRRFFDPAAQAAVPAMGALAAAMQSPPVVAAWERLCGIPLGGSFLRIEYCRDRAGFWLEPHTDIGAKRITVLIYLSTGPGAESWGTDIYDADKRPCGAVAGDFNCGLVFLPAAQTWHGFARRPIGGLRRSLMLNYVTADWRSRHELSFPDQPVGG